MTDYATVPLRYVKKRKKLAKLPAGSIVVNRYGYALLTSPLGTRRLHGDGVSMEFPYLDGPSWGPYAVIYTPE